MPNERDFVLHSWCVPGDWNAPTVVGGRGATLILEDGRELLDMSSLVECSNLGHQHPKTRRRHQGAGRQARLRDRRLGRRAPPGARRTPARGVRLRGRARVLHAGRRGRQRERGAHRAARIEKTPRPHRHARPLVPRGELHAHGAVGRCAHRAPGGRRGLGRAPRAAALRLPLPLRQHDAPTNAAAARPTRSRTSSTRRARTASPPS